MLAHDAWYDGLSSAPGEGMALLSAAALALPCGDARSGPATLFKSVEYVMLGEEGGAHRHLINMLRSYYAVISTVRDQIFRTNSMN